MPGDRSRNDPGTQKPPWFTEGAWIDVKYTSPRSDRDQFASGEVVADEEGVLTLEERRRNLEQTRVNEYREIIVDTSEMIVRSRTDERSTKLGHVVRINLSVPPWDSSADDVAAGWEMYATFDHRMVEQGVYRFPDPDYMERPEDWEADTDAG